MAPTPVSYPKPYEAVVLDIEGTTTPITFVHQVLFPYILEHAQFFLETHWDDSTCQNYLAGLAKQNTEDIQQGLTDIPTIVNLTDPAIPKAKKIKTVVANIRYQMQQDRKIKALKDFQGYMWKDGYYSGDLKATVYEDVIDALRTWHERGVPVYIYSSGSVPAQKLLFGYSDHGDLTHYLHGYYDTSVGSKLAPESYQVIAGNIGREPANVLFVSDNPKEIQAAEATGMQVVISLRPGNALIADDVLQRYLTITSFASLL
ncbi:enolase-phosphatase E1 [Dispira parvispora]|uniref:Enolase-phosphatase E1 n=1 Tax=Dispira parvispora TaxID=1520584 RepID=A0A9W8AX09_9FUNG|nr:enolase-phosphatase E1 [Dispira parvispora]